MTSRLEVVLNSFSGILLNLLMERSRYLRVLMLKTVALISLILQLFRVRLVRFGSPANAFGMSLRAWLKVELTNISCQNT